MQTASAAANENCDMRLSLLLVRPVSSRLPREQASPEIRCPARGSILEKVPNTWGERSRWADRRGCQSRDRIHRRTAFGSSRDGRDKVVETSPTAPVAQPPASNSGVAAAAPRTYSATENVGKWFRQLLARTRHSTAVTARTQRTQGGASASAHHEVGRLNEPSYFHGNCRKIDRQPNGSRIG